MSKVEQESTVEAAARKQSHLDLAFNSQNSRIDDRFYYEPMLAGHPNETDSMPVKFGSKNLRFPIWISSMTGGTSKAGPINKMLAQTASKFGFGMGLGSCRIILEDRTWFDDFNLRPILGDELPLFANIGIAQVEKLLARSEAHRLGQLVSDLDADGLIIHVNPIQEWLQPEGDHIAQPPVTTIEQCLNEIDIPIIVKEVGQGFGPESMHQLLSMPLLAIEFASGGGTNFAKLELKRNFTEQKTFENLTQLGHCAEEMIGFLNGAVDDPSLSLRCHHVIVSGGVRNFLDGYYFISKSKLNAVYGQAAAFLKAASESQETLDSYAASQVRGLLLAKQFLKVKP
ncbi:MAG: isopentenyl-diphosphate delta-isomerase [Planctomycetota bacterium]